MEYVAIVTALALMQAFVFAFQVGKARVTHGVDAPATTGPAEFVTVFRVHQNTVEQLIIFVPSLWMFAYYVRPDVAAGIGLVFIVGRQVYRHGYLDEPGNRGTGFLIGAVAMMILLLGSLVGAVVVAL